MPRKRRRQRTLIDIMVSGSGNQNLALGLLSLLPLAGIPTLLQRLAGNPLQAALMPAAKVAALFFGIGSVLFLVVAAIRYWQEWRDGELG